MKVSRKELLEGEQIPQGYGLAYHYTDRFVSVFYPIPFNLIVRLYLIIYHKIEFGLFRDRYEERLTRSYQKGYCKGLHSETNINKRKYIEKGWNLVFDLWKHRNLDDKNYYKISEELLNKALED